MTTFSEQLATIRRKGHDAIFYNNIVPFTQFVNECQKQWTPSQVATVFDDEKLTVAEWGKFENSISKDTQLVIISVLGQLSVVAANGILFIVQNGLKRPRVFIHTPQASLNHIDSIVLENISLHVGVIS